MFQHPSIHNNNNDSGGGTEFQLESNRYLTAAKDQSMDEWVGGTVKQQHAEWNDWDRADGFNLTNLQRCCQINAADRIDFKGSEWRNHSHHWLNVEEADSREATIRRRTHAGGWKSVAKDEVGVLFIRSRHWHSPPTLNAVVLMLLAGTWRRQGGCLRRTTTSGLMVIICRRLSRIDVDNGISIHIIRTIVDCVHKFKIYCVHEPKYLFGSVSACGSVFNVSPPIGTRPSQFTQAISPLKFIFVARLFVPSPRPQPLLNNSLSHHRFMKSVSWIPEKLVNADSHLHQHTCTYHPSNWLWVSWVVVLNQQYIPNQVDESFLPHFLIPLLPRSNVDHPLPCSRLGFQLLGGWVSSSGESYVI